MREKEKRTFPRLVLILTGTVLVFIWGRLLSGSLWIDETVTYWSVKDGVRELVHRVVSFQNQSPFYNLFLWAIKQIVGSSEPALRSLSVVAVLAACYTLYRIAERHYGSHAALLSVLVFVTLDDVVVAAINVRHYAFALLFSCLSVLALQRWVRSNRGCDLIWFIIATALTGYSQYLYLGIVLVHMAYLGTLSARAPGLRGRAKMLIGALLAAGVLLIPNMHQLKLVAARQEVLSFSPMPVLSDLLVAWAPLHVLLFAAAGLLAARMVSRLSFDWDLFKREGTPFVFFWWLVPALMCYAASHLRGTPIFVSRYYAWSAPAFAILLALFVSSLRPKKAQTAFVCAFMAVLFCGEIRKYRGDEDWRGAIEKARAIAAEDRAPVFAYTGLVESQDIGWLRDPEKRDYLLAPFSYYSLNAAPFLLPNGCNTDSASKYLSEQIQQIESSADLLVVILRVTYIPGAGGAEFSDLHFTRCFAQQGYEKAQEFDFQRVKVLTFRKLKLIADGSASLRSKGRLPREARL